MSAVAIALVLVAAALHAAWNLLLHDVDDRHASLAVAGLVIGVVSLPAIVVDPPTSVLGLVVLSVLTHTAYVTLLSAAFEHGSLTIAYPLARGTSPLLVTLGGWLVLSEQPTYLAITGAVLLGLGLALVGGAGRQLDQGTAVWFALLTGASIAAYSLIDASAVRETGPWGYVGVTELLVGVIMLVAVRGDTRRLRCSIGPGVLIGIGSLGAYLLVLLAFQRANAGQVSTLRETSVLIGMVASKEATGPLVAIGSVLVVAGAVMAAL